MALSEFEIRRMEKLVGEYVEHRRPPVHIRAQMDLSFRISGQSFEIFTIRPLWNDPDQQVESAVAKATWVRSKKIWKLFWMRSNMKWYPHTPCPEAGSLEEALDIIEQDAHACFWG